MDLVAGYFETRIYEFTVDKIYVYSIRNSLRLASVITRETTEEDVGGGGDMEKVRMHGRYLTT